MGGESSACLLAASPAALVAPAHSAALPTPAPPQVEIMHMRHKLDTDTKLIRWAGRQCSKPANAGRPPRQGRLGHWAAALLAWPHACSPISV